MLTEFVIYLILFGWIDAVLVFTEYGGVFLWKFSSFLPAPAGVPGICLGSAASMRSPERQSRVGMGAGEDLFSRPERYFESPQTPQASTAAALSRIYRITVSLVWFFLCVFGAQRS